MQGTEYRVGCWEGAIVEISTDDVTWSRLLEPWAGAAVAHPPRRCYPPGSAVPIPGR